MSKTICIGVPYYLGEKKSDRTEVQTLRATGIAEELNAEWVEIEPDFQASDDPVVAVNRALAVTIQANPDKVPVVFANDCTSCLGMVKGLEKRAPAVLWYDSHGDFNTPETTPSGFLGGMPLAALVGRGNQHLMRGIDLEPIAESDVIVSDGRNLDPEEGIMLRQSQVTIYETLQALNTAALPEKPLYIHFDTDVVDCEDMPAMSYPRAGRSLAAREHRFRCTMLSRRATWWAYFSAFGTERSQAAIALLQPRLPSFEPCGDRRL